LYTLQHGEWKGARETEIMQDMERERKEAEREREIERDRDGR
jgi:hypothetical protein